MGGCVVQVWFEAEVENAGRPARFQMIETEFEDFASFCEYLETGRLVAGAVLWTDRGGRGEKVIVERQPCAFRGSAVVRCQLPRWRFVEGVST